MILTYTELLLALALTTAIIAAVRCLYLLGKNTRLEERLAKTKAGFDSLAEENHKLRQVEKRFHSFKADLTQAELTAKMQKPRMEGSMVPEKVKAPERYQYIHSLARRGICSSEIASILSLSPREADQLVALSQLSAE